MHIRVVPEPGRHVGTDRGQDQNGNVDSDAVLPEPRDQTQQKQFQLDHDTADLVQPTPVREGFQEDQRRTGCDTQIEPYQQPLGRYLEHVPPEQDPCHTDVRRSKGNVPGASVGDRASRFGEEQSSDEIHSAVLCGKTIVDRLDIGPAYDTVL